MSNSFEKDFEPPEMETVANLAEDMVFRLPGCADIMVRKALQRAYYDFARLSCAITTRMTVPLVEGQVIYGIAAQMPRMQICAVRAVYVDGRKLGKGEYATHYDAVTISSFSVVNSHRLLTVVMQEIPRFGEEDAPRWFIDRYREAIVAGALRNLFMMDGKPWANAAQAQQENIVWENYLTEARLNSNTEGTNNGHLEVVDTSDLL